MYVSLSSVQLLKRERSCNLNFTFKDGTELRLWGVKLRQHRSRSPNGLRRVFTSEQTFTPPQPALLSGLQTTAESIEAMHDLFLLHFS